MLFDLEVAINRIQHPLAIVEGRVTTMTSGLSRQSSICSRVVEGSKLFIIGVGGGVHGQIPEM